LIEYNARFGDPEAMNILSVLESDFVKICQDLVGGSLNPEEVKFANKATVCKYVVPEGYPDSPVKGQEIDVSEVVDKDTLFYGSVDIMDEKLVELGSRTIAVTGVAKTIEEAEKIAEAEVNRIKGPLFHRRDIGTKELVQSRVDMMNEIRGVRKK
jgi:phosphoribosylamine--glycine ligase